MTQPEDRAHEATQALRDSARDATVRAPQVARKAAREEGRRTRLWSVAVASVVAVVVSLASLSLVLGVSRHQAATDASVSATRQLAEEAATAGQAANRLLAARGQQQVPIPQPGQAADSDVLVAAATARVLASLPTPRPTAAQLGEGIADYLAQHPITPAGPTPTQIAADLAGYFTVHPPPAGPTGPTGPSGVQGQPGQTGQDGAAGQDGQQGPEPTQAEIEADFADYLSQHPEALCPNGGVFSLVTNLLAADGTTYSGWICVTASTAPAPPSVPVTTDQPTTGGLLPNLLPH